MNASFPKPSRPTFLALLAILAVLPQAARGSGMLVPEGAGLPPLSIRYHRVDTKIQDQAASTTVVQVFQNNVDRVLEATYLFPLPKGAAIRDFSMIINGKKVQGELLDREKARGIYESIVRRLQDPGLLEYADNDVIRARVYPIPARGEQRIELTYSEQLTFDAGVVRYLYPLKTGGGSLRTLDDLTFNVSIASQTAIKSVVSPSHTIDVVRKDDLHASASHEQRQGSLNDDFLLYYTTSASDIGLSTVTYATASGDGYFMMMLAPRVEMPKGQVLPKDVTFIVDTSGSMSAEKMRQAQNGLGQCIRDLNPQDRFNVIRFSTEGEPFKTALVEASKANIDAAVAFVEGFRARGGTNIQEGLELALKTRGEGSRPHLVLFMTDGLPTIGETDTTRLVQMTRDKRGPETRIFCFGVGYDVNTKLLDTMSAENGGVSRYVKPEESVEIAVSSLWTRISEPVMGHPELRIDRVKVFDVYPKKLPDIFAADQIVLYGRYSGNGATAVRLAGQIAGRREEMVFEANFAEGRTRKEQNDFIPALWATRKVGFLLDEIRLKGENPELKEEVVRLSKEFGIMTPYTSFLVLPEEEQARMGNFAPGAPPRSRPADDRDGPSRRDKEDGRGFNQSGGSRLGAPSAASAPMSDAAAEAPSMEAMKAESGETAVRASKDLAKLKEGKKQQGLTTVRSVAGRTFVYADGAWVESTYDGKAPTLDVKYGSDAYFRILAVEPSLGKIFALGPRVTARAGKSWIRVGDTGRDQMTEDEIRAALR